MVTDAKFCHEEEEEDATSNSDNEMDNNKGDQDQEHNQISNALNSSDVISIKKAHVDK